MFSISDVSLPDLTPADKQLLHHPAVKQRRGKRETLRGIKTQEKGQEAAKQDVLRKNEKYI